MSGPAPGHVTAYGLAFPADEPEQMVAGAGGVVSSAHDMARWLSVQQRQGTTTDGRRLLPAAAVEQPHRARPGTDRAGLGRLLSGPGVEPARVGHSAYEISSGIIEITEVATPRPVRRYPRRSTSPWVPAHSARPPWGCAASAVPHDGRPGAPVGHDGGWPSGCCPT